VHLQQHAFCVLSDSGTISEESAMMGFPAVSIRTSTERPEAVDAGTIVLGGITAQEVLNAMDICLKTFDTKTVKLPVEYLVEDVSSRIIRIIQSYTSIVNKVIWNK
jgi:UDP-N-acetylglucosamine 2-epimerase (non-hydrolysing)